MTSLVGAEAEPVELKKQRRALEVDLKALVPKCDPDILAASILDHGTTPMLLPFGFITHPRCVSVMKLYAVVQVQSLAPAKLQIQRQRLAWRLCLPLYLIRSQGSHLPCW